ncbi:hypothetical protein TraAM80_00567 [Trypanosoma rangeli]|uniref:Uncharacterized protein n=1 Tax=Trypanosoma rangeli TaxID=5698 RepID=A0A3R7NUK1_TRYRA|nr:uncharacterized protein TraAM80_00567 [Trypanosoma rangeli]RNF12007.1 hypothetical protein TraAM80_00567 [Trypanosoma rangeli]|eukprot:RNF12007.1 hypothetical protein TraAM80_00567 [Trypanosoma rangeli]
MEGMGRVESVAEQGHLFHFVVDDVSPDVPDTTRARHYYVVSRDRSRVRAYFYLLLSLCELSDCARLSHWLALYSRLFGAISSERFLEMILDTAKTCVYQYVFFVDEYVAQLALNTLTINSSSTLCERNGGESRNHLFQTPKSAGTVELIEPLAEVDSQHHVEADSLHKCAASSMSLAEHTMLESRSREVQLLLQQERNQREIELAALREAMTEMKQKLVRQEQEHQKRLRHHFVEHQGELHRLEDEKEYREAQVYRTQGAMLREQECLIQQLSEENVSLQQRHHESSIEAERWRMKCQELRHILNNTVKTALSPLNTVSREQYNDLERRHQLLHKEFDELSLERSEVEQLLRQTRQELHQRRAERDSAVQVLDVLQKGLDYVGRKLPLVCEVPATYVTQNFTR